MLTVWCFVFAFEEEREKITNCFRPKIIGLAKWSENIHWMLGFERPLITILIFHLMSMFASKDLTVYADTPNEFIRLTQINEQTNEIISYMCFLPYFFLSTRIPSQKFSVFPNQPPIHDQSDHSLPPRNTSESSLS